MNVDKLYRYILFIYVLVTLIVMVLIKNKFGMSYGPDLNDALTFYIFLILLILNFIMLWIISRSKMNTKKTLQWISIVFMVYMIFDYFLAADYKF